jgi:hypothetical protein
MAIDRIGKGGAPPVGHEPAAGVDKKSGVDAPFSVDRTEPVATKAKVGAVGELEQATPLARLRAGEIELRDYVELKVDEATHGLHGLSAAELEDIKSVLRDQLSSDPGLRDLVQTATGREPEPPQD